MRSARLHEGCHDMGISGLFFHGANIVTYSPAQHAACTYLVNVHAAPCPVRAHAAGRATGRVQSRSMHSVRSCLEHSLSQCKGDRSQASFELRFQRRKRRRVDPVWRAGSTLHGLNVSLKALFLGLECLGRFYFVTRGGTRHTGRSHRVCRARPRDGICRVGADMAGA
jgi:hypothetical protein